MCVFRWLATNFSRTLGRNLNLDTGQNCFMLSLCPYARHSIILASAVDRDVNGGPVDWNWLRRWFQRLNLSFTSFTLLHLHFYIYILHLHICMGKTPGTVSPCLCTLLKQLSANKRDGMWPKKIHFWLLIYKTFLKITTSHQIRASWNCHSIEDIFSQ